MLERLVEVLGGDVADTVLAHLPPQGERMATAAQIDGLRAATTTQIEELRAATTAQVEELRATTTAQIEGLEASTTAQIEGLRASTAAQIEGLRASTAAQIEGLRAEMHHLFELQGERFAARWRRDLLLLAVPQFLLLLGIVVSLNA